MFTGDQQKMHHRFLAYWTKAGYGNGYRKRNWRDLDTLVVRAITDRNDTRFETLLTEARALYREQTGRDPNEVKEPT